MDAFCLAAIIRELQIVLLGATIDRVVQPDRWSLMLVFQRYRSGGLLLSVKPGAPRVELRPPPRKSSLPASRFGDLVASKTKEMLIEAVEQVGMDRIMAIQLRGGVLTEAAMTLYLEMLGSAGNVMLVDRITGTVMDRLRSTSDKARGKTPEPGEPYQPSLDCDRIDPGLVEENGFRGLVRSRLADGIEPARILTTCVTGFGSLMAAELVARSGLSAADSLDEQAGALWKALCDLMGRVAAAAFEPRLLLGSDGKPVGIAAFPLVTVAADHQVPYPTMIQALAAYYESREQVERVQALRSGLQRRLQSELSATERLSARLEQEAILYREGELHARRGRLLLAHRADIRRGQQTIELPDYAELGTPLRRIELDPACSVEENAQRYFALHRKAKRGAAIVTKRLEEASMRLATLRSLIRKAETANLTELQRIDAALARMARRRPVQGPAARRTRESEGPEPRTFRSSDGLPILVGKNEVGNDHLTWRLARPHDLWLHAQGIRGSHVLVRLSKGKPVPPRTLCEAAQLAAYYSRARGQVKVPVDYVLRKFLRKPKAAAPGAVLLTQEKTITVRPEADLVRRLHAATDASRAED